MKVEATSFIVSEPIESPEISPLLYAEATEQQRQVLENNYEIDPFTIGAINLERIFADKILAAEFYYRRHMLFDTAKHLYDLTTMMEQDRIQNLLASSDTLVKMLAYKRREEKDRIGSDFAKKPFCEFSLFKAIGTDAELSEVFLKMQEVYIFSQSDTLSPSKLLVYMDRLKQTLLKLDENFDMT